MSNAPALLPRLTDIVEEYEQKLTRLDELKQELQDIIRDCENTSSIGGSYGGSIWSRGGKPNMESPERALRSSAWRYVYKGLNIDRIAPAAERDRFERELDDPPEFTLENIRATFGDYVANPREHILRGLAEVFVNLDPAYKSHSKVKIGVAGLPKRVIISSAIAPYGYGRQKITDMLGALRSAQGKPAIEHRELYDAMQNVTKEDVELDGVTLRGFQNGNIHVIFDKQTCTDINLALAEFYGDVLPDVEEEVTSKRTGTAVSKDLAYYPTPHAVTSRILSDIYIRPGSRVLEPSCGCGRIMDAVREQQPDVVLRGIEYDAGRVSECRLKGHSVQTANFLDVPPDPTFDYVIMNPPFAGKHWRKHIDHAMRFLANGGVLVSILPASAWYDGHIDDVSGAWRDLPVASFAESGTNVPTGYFKIWKK